MSSSRPDCATTMPAWSSASSWSSDCGLSSSWTNSCWMAMWQWVSKYKKLVNHKAGQTETVHLWLPMEGRGAWPSSSLGDRSFSCWMTRFSKPRSSPSTHRITVKGNQEWTRVQEWTWHSGCSRHSPSRPPHLLRWWLAHRRPPSCPVSTIETFLRTLRPQEGGQMDSRCQIDLGIPDQLVSWSGVPELVTQPTD